MDRRCKDARWKTRGVKWHDKIERKIESFAMESTFSEEERSIESGMMREVSNMDITIVSRGSTALKFRRNSEFF
jgi:hypothetical protein